MELLQRIVKLSHKFGTGRYVKGGGGNTSVKDEHTLWIKPSGTTLCGLTEESFVPISRAVIGTVRDSELSSDVAEREQQAKEILLSAVEKGATGRPSVETMLHNSFISRFVVHTHPALVNGMTCGVNGRAQAQELFPESIWIEYTDPGYILFLRVDDEIKLYRTTRGQEPKVVFLENHGVFVAGDSEQEIIDIYAGIMQKLEYVYAGAGIEVSVPVADKTKSAPADAQKLADLLGLSVCSSGNFALASGPLTPDHIVYAKSYPFTGAITRENLDFFKTEHGYYPVISVADGNVFSCGVSESRADLAMQLALDGALVCRLCEAFDGVRYMSDAARDFIENWEAESYRSAVMK